PEQIDLLRLLAGEAEPRADTCVVAVELRARMGEHERQDELLDEAEDPQVPVAAGLAEHAPIVGREAFGGAGARKVLGQERAGEVERGALRQHVIDLPRGAGGGTEHAGEVVVVIHGWILALGGRGGAQTTPCWIAKTNS